MASTTLWSAITAVTLMALVFCLSLRGATSAALHNEEAVKKDEEGAPKGQERFRRSDDYDETLARLRAQGLTPSKLRHLLREESRRSRLGGQKESGQPATGGSSPSGAEAWQRQQRLKDAAALNQHDNQKKRWLDLYGGSSVETRFPLPERRQFPEVDWRGFNEDVFHESFGDFSPMKRWRRRAPGAPPRKI